MSDSRPDKVLAVGKHLRLVNRGGWECVERIGGPKVVGIVAVTGDGKLLLVEQYRPPVKQPVIELPAGLVGDLAGQEHEDPIQAARRELEEETGYRPGTIVALGSGAISAGMSDEVITAFLATDLTRVGPGGGDHTESIRVHEVPLDHIHDWLNKRVADGAMLDIKVYAGLYLAGIGPAKRSQVF